MTNALFNTPLRRLSVVRAAAVGAFSLAALAPAAAQSCNPLEFLFGGCRPQQESRPIFTPIPSPLAASRPSPVPRSDKAAARARAASIARSGGVSGKQTALAPAADAPVGSLALFSRDRTLRSGDIVVTKTGFLVYGGRTGAFAPISHESSTLAALEKASIKGRSAAFAAPAQAISETTPTPAVSTTQIPATKSLPTEVPMQRSASTAVPGVNSWLALRREAAIERRPVETATGGSGG